MQAIRSLPLINRPSRSASPATNAPHIPNGPGAPALPALSMGPPALPGVNPDMRARSLTRHAPSPLSHTATSSATSAPPTPTAQAVPTVVRSQPLGGKKSSPPTSRVATPRTMSTALPSVGTESTTPQGGYMDVIGLRINDAINKACVGVDVKAKKGYKSGAGWAIGESVAHELPPPPADAYLLRAILRTVIRSLSIYTSRLESLLVPVLTDVAFTSPFNLTPGAHGSPLNSTQAFAVSVAHAAWETCEKLEQMIENGEWPRFVEDTLRPTMDKLDLVVGKVVKPLLLALKNDLEGSLARTDGVTVKSTAGPATVPAPAPAVVISREHSQQPGARLTKEPSGSGHARQLAVPPCLQQFASRVDGARRVLEIVAAPCQHDGEGWVARVVVAIVWRGMRIVAENDVHVPNRPPSPGSVARALAGLGKDKEAVPTVVSSPSLTHVTAKLTNSLSILPSRAQSRPPSPPRKTPSVDPSTHALMSLEGLIKRLVGGLVQPPTAASTGATNAEDQEAEHIAREALHEALEALESFCTASAAVHGLNASARILASVRRLRDDIDDDKDEMLDDALEDLPAVSLFGIIQRRANVALAALGNVGDEKEPVLRIRKAAELWGWTNAEYERQVVSGFGPAEEWGPRVASALKPEIERVLSALAVVAAEGFDKAARETIEAAEWVKALGVALDARTGVKAAGAI